MKNEFFTFLALTFMILISYGCKKDNSASIQEQKPEPTASIVSGTVVVWFADNVDQACAKRFIRDLSITINDSSRYNLRGPHELDLQVPVGQELKWSDSLKTFPIVVEASPIYAVYND